MKIDRKTLDAQRRLLAEMERSTLSGEDENITQDLTQYTEKDLLRLYYSQLKSKYPIQKDAAKAASISENSIKNRYDKYLKGGTMKEKNKDPEYPEGYWHIDPQFPIWDWKYEVANGDTRTGYHEWVKGKKLENTADDFQI